MKIDDTDPADVCSKEGASMPMPEIHTPVPASDRQNVGKVVINGEAFTLEEVRGFEESLANARSEAAKYLTSEVIHASITELHFNIRSTAANDSITLMAPTTAWLGTFTETLNKMLASLLRDGAPVEMTLYLGGDQDTRPVRPWSVHGWVTGWDNATAEITFIDGYTVAYDNPETLIAVNVPA